MGISGDPEKKKLTINDVARVAGVSKKTVSRAINREATLNAHTLQHIDDVIARLGYVPNPQARALARGHSSLIGLLHSKADVEIVSIFQKGVLNAIDGTEFALCVKPLDAASPTLASEVRAFIQQQRLFGVIIVPPISEDVGLSNICAELECRYIRIGAALEGSPDRLVLSNDRLAVGRAIDHLIARGHRQIGLVEGPAGLHSSQQRKSGFVDAMKRHEINWAANLAIAGDYSFASGLRAGDALLDLAEAPTAIFACNDEMAAGVLQAALRRDVTVPDRLSIIGFDDSAIASHVWPPLTTIHRPIDLMGRAAAMRLIAQNGDGDQAKCFDLELIVRGTVGTIGHEDQSMGTKDGTA